MFIMKIHGDSMNRAGIDNGDMVIVDIEREPKNGNIVVARVDDECTIKRYYKTDHTITLSPDSRNPEHQPMIFTKSNKIVIHGVVDSIYLKRLK
jgi:SOS-response transcriptional repressor LexA